MMPAQRRLLARTISAVENRADDHRRILREAYGAASWPAVVAVTGAPGAGKSTLVDALAAHWAAAGEEIAILAVDPSSPFSGGAVLGDRIRMERCADLPNVYLRSLSSRGHVGGISAAATDVIAVLAREGFARVLLETVGAGQSDVEVNDCADCTLVVHVPGLGDGVQASKAGIMEIGDVYVVNKADRPGASITRSEIDATLSIAYRGRPGVNASATLRPSFDTRVASPGVRAVRDRHGDPDADAMLWRPPVHEVCARTGEGVDALASSVDAYLQWAGDSGRIARKRHERLRTHLLRLLADRLLEPFQQRADGGDSPVDAWARRVVAGEASPGEAVERLIESVSGRVPAATRGDLPPDAGPTARRSRV